MTSPQSTTRETKAQARADKAYRKAQRPFYQKKRFFFLAILAVIVITIIANTGGGDEPGATVNGGQQEQAAEFVPAFAGATEDDVVAEAGQAVTADGVTTTTTALTTGDSTLGDTLCTTATYDNGSDAPAAFSSFDWKLQDPNGAILSPTIAGSSNILRSGELAPGGTMTADVCFDAPQGDASGQFVVLLDPSFRFSSDRIAWLNNVG
jgi:hypothetical protein